MSKNKRFSTTLLLVFLGIAFLSISIYLTAASKQSPEQVIERCSSSCSPLWEEVDLWMICMDSCLTGAIN